MTPFYDKSGVMIYTGDCRAVLAELPDESVQCVVTSPPYWGLRDYGVDGQIGLESTAEKYVETMRGVFAEVRRVLRDDGTLWLNMGDCYATGAGKVGDCPGGGEQGERWKGYRASHSNNNSGKQNYRMVDGGHTQPNRLPLPGLKPKDLIGMPWRLAFALQSDGWYLRSDIIWHKPNPMPESVRDRPTKAHEYLFLLAKSQKYYYDANAIQEKWADDRQGQPGEYLRGKRPVMPDGELQRMRNGNLAATHANGRNKRSVWTIATAPYPKAHFATFPPKLIEPCILAGCPAGGIVLDPFLGSGTTAQVAKYNGRKCVGIELNEDYAEMATKRVSQEVLF